MSSVPTNPYDRLFREHSAARARRAPPSISPNSFDPTTASGRPKPTDPSAPPRDVELAVETPVVRKTATVQVRPEDKAVFDALQAWWHFRHGSRLTQWELFSLVLAAAVSNREGALAPALEVL